jgi:hypothetical protein
VTYAPPPITAAPGRFDMAATSRAVSEGLATVPMNRRLAILAHADLTSAGVGIGLRLGGHFEFTARVSMPYKGKFDASADARVTFLKSPPPEPAGVKLVFHILRTPVPGLLPNSIARAAWKAAAFVWLGWRPFLDGACWFD